MSNVEIKRFHISGDAGIVEELLIFTGQKRLTVCIDTVIGSFEVQIYDFENQKNFEIAGGFDSKCELVANCFCDIDYAEQRYVLEPIFAPGNRNDIVSYVETGEYHTNKKWMRDIIKFELENDEHIKKYGFIEKNGGSYVWYNTYNDEIAEVELEEEINYIATEYEISLDELVNPLLIEERYKAHVYVVFGKENTNTPFAVYPWLIIVDDANVIKNGISLEFLEEKFKFSTWGLGCSPLQNISSMCRIIESTNPEEVIAFLNEEEDGRVYYTSLVE